MIDYLKFKVPLIRRLSISAFYTVMGLSIIVTLSGLYSFADVFEVRVCNDRASSWVSDSGGAEWQDFRVVAGLYI